METPICDFLNEYSKKNSFRLHMPGHKGSEEKADITEIDGADVLYSSNGIIKESQINASKLFKSGKTVYSAEGSSLAIRAMLKLVMLYAKEKGIKPVVLAGRNAHKTFLTASALLDFDIRWIYPEKQQGILFCEITPENLRKELELLKKADMLPAAVYITSPDYLGNIADIKGISCVCKEYKTLLVVDNAHGAYLKFLKEDIHPITLGADMCCDSAHKTLPVLTGGAYLHISKNAPSILFGQAESAMALFASTSPSYLILESLDKVNKYLSDGYDKKLSYYRNLVCDLKEKIKAVGIPVVGDEPLKLTLMTKPYGYKGTDFAGILYEKNIVCEFSDPDYVVMMFTPENGREVFEAVEKAILEIPKRPPVDEMPPMMKRAEKRLSPREAVFSPGKAMRTDACVGKILASPSVSCPPAIPIAVCGEVITEEAAKLFAYYGIEKIYIIEQSE